MKRKFITGLAIPALVVAIGVGGNNDVANAKEITNESVIAVEKSHYSLPSEDVQSLKEFLSAYNVEETTQKNLIDKLERGEIWDSITGQEPVSTYEITKENDAVETISTFADGSIVVSTIEPTIVEVVPASEVNVNPLAVDPGTITSGSGYKSFKKAKAYVYSGIANAHFYADFTIVNGGNDYITRVYDYKIVGIGGGATYDDLRIVRPTENLSGKASAKLDFTYVAFNGAGSTTCWLKLFVGNDSYSTDYSY